MTLKKPSRSRYNAGRSSPAGRHKDSRSLLSVCQRRYILSCPDMLQFAEYSRILAHFATLFKLLIYAPASMSGMHTSIQMSMAAVYQAIDNKRLSPDWLTRVSQGQLNSW